jgi:tetratricopeptide (TPR) repeat protein
MPVTARSFAAIFLTLAAGATSAQAQVLNPLPDTFQPTRPLSVQEKNQREALKLYAQALVCVREDKLLEGVKALEESARLDPESSEVLRNLVRLYLALDRNADALRLGQRVVELDPNDYESWHLYSRMLKAAGRPRQSVDALKRGLACPDLKEQPDEARQMTYDLALMHESLRNYVEAAAALAEVGMAMDSSRNLADAGPQEIQDLKQRAAELLERAGKNFLQARKYDDAIRTFREAQKRYPEGAGRLNYHLALVCKDQGRPQEALRYLDAYLQLQPGEIEPFELKIALQQALDKENEIVPSLEQYVQRDPHNVRLRMLLARQFTRFRQPERAEAIYLELTRRSPSPDVYQDLFVLYQATPGRGVEAVANLLNSTLGQATVPERDESKAAAATQARGMLVALRNDKQLCTALLRYTASGKVAPGLRFDTLHLLALLADHNGALDQAEYFYRRCLPGVTRGTETAIYGGLLRVLWKARKFENIVEVCRQGLQLTQAGNAVLYHTDAARALTQLGRMPAALAEADQAVQSAGDEERPGLRRFRILLLTRAGQADRAVAECQEMLKQAVLTAEVNEVRHLLSNAYSSAKDFARAEEQLEQILKIDPNDATANNDLGYLWADQGRRLKEAEELIRKAIELGRRQRRAGRGESQEPPDNAAYLDSLGWVLYRQNRLAEAKVELEKATGLPDGNDPVIWEHLGDVYVRLGQAAQARTAYARSVQLYEQDRRQTLPDPHCRDVKQKIKLLERETHP